MEIFYQKQKGFTLIELLIVIAVVGVMATVLMIAVNPIEQMAKGRDGGRRNTTGSLASALQSYYVVNGGYPAANTTWISSLVDIGELKNVPRFIDYSLYWPRNSYCSPNRQNGYCYNNDGTNVYIFTRLEASSEGSKCGDIVGDYGHRPWFVWSSCSGKSGLVCGYEPNIVNVCNFTFEE